jgi:hypothetical protein
LRKATARVIRESAWRTYDEGFVAQFSNANDRTRVVPLFGLGRRSGFPYEVSYQALKPKLSERRQLFIRSKWSRSRTNRPTFSLCTVRDKIIFV